MVIYNRDIPDAPNNPSVDQPKMKENFNSIDTLLAVDHVSFNANNGGFHKQIDFALKATPAAPVDPVSVAFTQNSVSLTEVTGGATTIAQEFYRNQNGIFPVSSVRAFGVFIPVALAAPTILNGFNIASTAFAAASYQITFNANTVNGTNIIVLTNQSGITTNPIWTFSGSTLSFTNNVLANGSSRLSFLVLQV